MLCAITYVFCFVLCAAYIIGLLHTVQGSASEIYLFFYNYVDTFTERTKAQYNTPFVSNGAVCKNGNFAFASFDFSCLFCLVSSFEGRFR